MSQKTLCNLLRFFRIFGFVPFSFTVTNSRVHVTLQKPFPIAILLLLMAYWFTLGLKYFNSTSSSSRFSLVSNWIQMATNGFALTIVLGAPITAAPAADEIFELLSKIDVRVAAMGVAHMIGSESFKIIACVSCFALVILTMGAFEAFVLLIRHKLCGSLYWLLTFVPGVVVLAALTCSLCLLLLIRNRIAVAHAILVSELRSTSDFVQIIRVCSDKTVEQSVKSTMPCVFHLYNDIVDLSHAVERLLGPIFLAAFMSVFVIVTTQTYHTYTIVMTPRNDYLGYTAWSAAVCVNTVVVYLAGSVLLTSMCESIANQSHECMRITMKMRLNGSRYFTPEDIQKMTTAFQFSKGHISFSAVGFFKINYKMLCGMFSSILTYLIIYIQFFSLYSNIGTRFHNKSSGQMRDVGF